MNYRIGFTLPFVTAAALVSPVRAGPPATMPVASPAVAALRAKLVGLNDALDRNDEALAAVTPGPVLADPKRRAAIAPQARDLLADRLRLLDEKTHYTPHGIDPKERRRVEVMQYLLGDPATVARVDAMSGGSAGEADGIRLQARWLAAGGTAEGQKVIAADADRLAAARPDDQALTQRIVALVTTAASVEVRNDLLRTVTQTSHNLVSQQVKDELDHTRAAMSMQESAERQRAYVGQPMVVAGPTVDGKPFSTADLIGRVVVIDFWATWCGPCKAELPHIRAMYDRYHARGLEVVGVSSDEAAGPLRAYVAQHGLPWPQLFDAAVPDGQRQALPKRYDVAALPTMFVIDRRGTCRSVTARHELDDLIPKLLAE